MEFELYMPKRVLFGAGVFEELPRVCAGLGSRFLLLTGGSSLRKSGLLQRLEQGLAAAGVDCVPAAGIAAEPQVEDVDLAVKTGLEHGVDAVLAVGGGSVIDTGKAARGVLTNGGSVRDYLEGVGGGKMRNDPLPFVAVPTTAGTGSEATKNAVISSAGEGFKKSMRDARLLPDAAVIDPAMTVHAPGHVTASSGMDAICQLIESYVTPAHNPFCDALALHNIPRALRAVKRAYDCPEDMDARRDMCVASFSSGVCLANAGLGAAHGFAAGLGARLSIPHGVACGMLLPHVMRHNYERGVRRYEDIAAAAYGSGTERDVQRLIAEIESLNAYMGVPADLKGHRIAKEAVPPLAAASMGSSMRKNPVAFTLTESERFLYALI